jgi:hypothetical protein
MFAHRPSTVSLGRTGSTPDLCRQRHAPTHVRKSPGCESRRRPRSHRGRASARIGSPSMNSFALSFTSGEVAVTPSGVLRSRSNRHAVVPRFVSRVVVTAKRDDEGQGSVQVICTPIGLAACNSPVSGSATQDDLDVVGELLEPDGRDRDRRCRGPADERRQRSCATRPTPIRGSGGNAGDDTTRTQ